MARILCIDDDRDTLDVRERVLRSAGYEVLTAPDGMQGMEIAFSEPVDVVLLDYMMPSRKGDEIAEELKSHFPRLPIIAVSAVQLPGGMRQRVDAYVQKGQDVEVLLTTIARVISASAGLKSNGGSSKKKVLCADDEINELAARKMVFESAGFEVFTARNGAQALDVFRAESVNAVVLDYFMPGMNGLSVAREMKRLRPEIPIVVLSGFASLPGETIGLVDVWLQKRDVEELVRQLEKLMERKLSGPSVAHQGS